MADLADKVEHLLQAIQDNLYQKALGHARGYTRAVDSYDEFKEAIEGAGSSWHIGTARPRPRNW
jgi:hypothetical protein